MELHEALERIAEQHRSVPQQSSAEIDRAEKAAGQKLPEDLRAFYRRFSSASVQQGLMGWLYSFLPLNQVRPVSELILDKEPAPPGTAGWLAVCDVQDGNYIALDPRSGTYIDCFHETFGVPGQCAIVAISFGELVTQCLTGGNDQLFFLKPQFVAHGDALLGRT